MTRNIVVLTMEMWGVMTGLGYVWWWGQTLPLWNSVFFIIVPSATVFIGSVFPPLQLPPLAFYDLSVPSWWPVWHASNYVPPRPPSRPQLLVRRFLVSTGPSLKSWTQLFLYLMRESPTSVSSIVSLPLNLFNLSETSASFQCLDFQWPHLRPFQDKTTINYQDNKCSLPVLSFSYWTPSSKTHDGWIHSSSSWLLLDWENCTTIPTVPLQIGSHGWPTQFFLRPNMDPQPCLSILSKIITNLHYPPGAL